MRESLDRHDRHVDQEQDEEDEVGAGDVLAGLVQGQRGHQRCAPLALGTAGAIRERAAGGASPPSIARRSRRRRPRAAFAASSKRTSVTHSSADRRRGRQEGEQHVARQAAVRGCEDARMDERRRKADGEEVEGHEGAGGDREDRGVARLPFAVGDRVAQRVVGAVEEEDDQEAHERRLVPHPPLAP